MKQLFNVPVNYFSLEKITLNKDKTAQVKFAINDDSGDVTDTYRVQMEPSYQTTMKFQEKLNELKQYLCKVWNDPEHEWAKVNVVGCVWQGEGEKEAFIINGNKLSDSDQVMKHETCKINIEQNNFGFEVEVRVILIELEQLAHAYILKNERPDVSFGLTAASGEEDNVIEAEEVE